MKEAVCTCKEGYYGDLCEFRSNACTQAIINLKVTAVDLLNQRKKDHKVTYVITPDAESSYTGNQLCNVNMSGESIDGNEHNMCFPELGTRDYQCKCVFPFQEDLNLGTHNCIIKRTACDKHLCLHGTCVQSPDERTEAVCLCEPDWEGDLCDSPADQWGPWTDCQPTCGVGRKRFRWRQALVGDEDVSYRRITQAESCSDRVGNDCPSKDSRGEKSSPYLTGKLKFVEQVILSMCVGLGGFGIIFFIYINSKISGTEPIENVLTMENI